MILFKQDTMNILISFLCFFYLCVDCSAVPSIPNAIGVDAVQKLTEKLNSLELRLTREHPYLHDVRNVPLPNENSNKANEGWVRDVENRIETLKNTILQKNCDKKFQFLEETVKELSKQQALYNKRTEYLEAIVRDQEKTISKLREDMMQIKKPGSVIRESLVQTDDQNDKDRTAKHDAHNQSGIPKRIRRSAVSSDLQNIDSINKRLLFPTTQQPVTTPTIIAFYAYMATDTPSITIQHPLVFDVVKTNNGNGYHATTGVFIAPETGVYVFTWTIRETNDCYHSIQLMLNNAEIGIIHVHAGSGGGMSGTGVVVTHVNAGDDIYVRTHASWNNCNIFSDRAGRSSFAGWKLS